MHSKKNVLLLVIDAVGVSTLEYLLSRHNGAISLPNLSRLGLKRALAQSAASKISGADGGGFAAVLNQASACADSVIGHREMMGLIDDRTYKLFPDGFPPEFIARFEQTIGRKTIFNRMAGGMEAIELNAAEHEKTGFPIVYSSKCDPLIQVAMNEAVIPVAEQHKITDTAFKIASRMGIQVTRCIDRAYVRGAGGEIVRTANRHDAVQPMEGKTLADIFYASKVWTAAVGKTSELVNTAYREKIKLSEKEFLDPALELKFVHPGGKDTNPFTVQGIVNALDEARNVYRPRGTFIFANAVDTDSLYGHSRDVEGGLAGIAEMDRMLPLFESRMNRGDLLMITADHGMEHRRDYGYHHKEPLFLLAEEIGGEKIGDLPPLAKNTLAASGWLAARIFGLEKEFVRECGLERFFPG